MPIAASVELPVKSKDPSEMVKEWARLVQANATDLERLEITLSLTCRSNAGVLLRVAQRLPLMALGFKIMGSDRGLTAGEFRAQTPSGICTFQGTLTEHFPPTQVFALIEELLTCQKAAVRSTSFDIGADNLRWRGALPDSTGSVHLSDLKGFKRARRFCLCATLKIAGEDPKGRAVRDSRKQVFDATGIPFQKGAVYRIPGREHYTAAYGEAVLVWQICFEEAVCDTASGLAAGSIGRLAPSAIPQERAFYRRAEEWGCERSERVNLAGLLKSVIKQTLPELTFDSSDADAIVFTKRQSWGGEVFASFLKTNPRLGKSFSLDIGLRSADGCIRFQTNVWRLEAMTETRSWIYSTTEEATAAVNEAIKLAQHVFSSFEPALHTYFNPWPGEVPAGIERLGNLTAKEAHEKARSVYGSRFPDAQLIRIFNHARSLKVRDTQGPELSFEGRLVPNAEWWFHLYSPEQDLSFEVTVPAVGRVQLLTHGDQYRDEGGRRYLVPVGDEWLDSDRVLAIAEERGGRERRNSGKTWGLLAKLQKRMWPNPYWAVMYLVSDERGRNDLIVNLDAVSGEELSGIRGF